MPALRARRGSARRLAASIVSFAFGIGMLALTAPPAMAASCTIESGVATVTTTATFVSIYRNSSNDFVAEDYFGTQLCAGAATSATVTGGADSTEEVWILMDQFGIGSPIDGTQITLNLGDLPNDSDSLTVYGTTGADTMKFGTWSGSGVARFGASNDDDVLGLDSVETLTVNGGAGTDVVTGSPAGATAWPGFMFIYGDDDSDMLTSSSAGNYIEGGAGNDLMAGGPGSDTLIGGDGDDTMSGNDGDDYLTGDLGTDVLNGNGDNDQLFGGAGDDTLNGGAGDIDILVGDAGADSMSGGDGSLDRVTYGPATCAVTANLDGLVGDGCSGEGDTIGTDVEQLQGGSGNDVLTGDGNENRLLGNPGDDVLNGGAGVDSLEGDAGNDTLNGGDDGDTLRGSVGTDTLNGGAGDDRLIGGADGDALDGGGNDANGDTADYSLEATAITVNLDRNSGRGAAAGDTFVGIENVTGTNFKDTIAGDASANVLKGGNGDDSLKGGDGDDTIYGEGGAGDVAVGGAGSDTCIAERQRTCEA
ncbi:MAG: calcium-binding protein [Actinomycetota bacterium]